MSFLSRIILASIKQNDSCMLYYVDWIFFVACMNPSVTNYLSWSRSQLGQPKAYQRQYRAPDMLADLLAHHRGHPHILNHTLCVFERHQLT